MDQQLLVQMVQIISVPIVFAYIQWLYTLAYAAFQKRYTRNSKRKSIILKSVAKNLADTHILTLLCQQLKHGQWCAGTSLQF